MHGVTACCLYMLRQGAYDYYCAGENVVTLDFNAWCEARRVEFLSSSLGACTVNATSDFLVSQSLENLTLPYTVKQLLIFYHSSLQTTMATMPVGSMSI